MAETLPTWAGILLMALLFWLGIAIWDAMQ